MQINLEQEILKGKKNEGTFITKSYHTNTLDNNPNECETISNERITKIDKDGKKND